MSKNTILVSARLHNEDIRVSMVKGRTTSCPCTAVTGASAWWQQCLAAVRSYGVEIHRVRVESKSHVAEGSVLRVDAHAEGERVGVGRGNSFSVLTREVAGTAANAEVWRTCCVSAHCGTQILSNVSRVRQTRCVSRPQDSVPPCASDA